MTTKHFAQVTLPFGPDMTTFCLTVPQAGLWEKEREKSLNGTFLTMVAAMTCEVEDIRSLIRHGLMGAGRTHADAIVFVSRHVDGYPVTESMEVAMTIAEATLYGSKEWHATNGRKSAGEAGDVSKVDADGAQV
jgi:hypothetical protein